MASAGALEYRILNPKPPDPHAEATAAHTMRQVCPSSAAVDAINPNSKPSYASMVMGSSAPCLATHKPTLRPRFAPISLPTRQVGVKDGRPAISFSGAELGAGEKRFEFSLIAKFTVGRPPIAEIQKAFQEAWHLTGRATISQIFDARHVLIILDSETDVRVALSSSLRKIGHAFFRLFRWTSDYNPKKESKVATVWVRLTGLPLGLYDASFVEAIVATFGDFVAVDERTKACVAVNYARACVELDVTRPIPDSVWISLPNDKGFWQPIEVESNLRYCNKCKVHGHSASSCRKAKAYRNISRQEDTAAKVVEEGSWQKVVHKKNYQRAVRGVYVQKESPIISAADVMEGNKNSAGDQTTPSTNETAFEAGKAVEAANFSDVNKNTSVVIVQELTCNPESHGDQLTPSINDITAEAGKGPDSCVPLNVPGAVEGLPGPIIGDLGHHSHGTGAEELRDSVLNAEVYYNETLQSHVHPDGEDHYMNIANKIGSASNFGGVSYVTKRTKNKDTKGSEHCPSPSSP